MEELPPEINGYVLVPWKVIGVVVAVFGAITISLVFFIRDMVQAKDNRTAEEERARWRLYDRGIKLGHQTFMDCLKEQQFFVRYKRKKHEPEDKPDEKNVE